MQPEVDQVFSVRDVAGVRFQKALENIGEMPHVELIVEIRRRSAEVLAHL